MAVFSARVTAGADDGYARDDTSAFDSAGANGFLGELAGAGPGATMNWFARILVVTIPQGSTINTANIVLTASDNKTADTIHVKLMMEDADDAVAPTSYAEFGALVRTTAKVDWDFTTNWATDSEYTSPDFKAAVQEVVSRGGWASGADMQVIIDDDGSDADAERWFYSFDGSAAKCLQLNIDYDPPESGGMAFYF